MRYAIITNPVSGTRTVDQKRATLKTAAKILDAEIHGLDTTSAEEFVQCAQDLVSRCDVLVIAGGDGTFSDIINSIDTAQTPVAYLPLGTGNAMGYALKYRGRLVDIAARIINGKLYGYDLINCGEKRRAFTASVGIEGTIIRLRNQFVAQGNSGLKAYVKATIDSYLKEYKRATATILLDGRMYEVKTLLSLMVVKHPYYGFGMNVVPRARFDDRQLHTVCINSGLFKSAIGGITAFTVGNRIGQYRKGRQLTVTLDRPLLLQNDGNEGWVSDSFSFTVLPNALKIKC